ncbi:MAG: hypothetical protein LBE08_10570 [Bifidobacteriaceae bacterium]|nr:hypothetical protein [Bifidobacteriaceae bacterium]
MLITLAVGLAIVMAVWLAASRIDRLHRRVENSWASLQLQLTRRASMALVAARDGVWAPEVCAAVEAAARAALVAPPHGREHSQLTDVLRQAMADPDQLERDLADPVRSAALHEIGGAWYRACLARRFLNDAVCLARRLRSRRLVKVFHLAGRATLPVTCDIDDEPPDGLPLV